MCIQSSGSPGWRPSFLKASPKALLHHCWLFYFSRRRSSRQAVTGKPIFRASGADHIGDCSIDEPTRSRYLATGGHRSEPSFAAVPAGRSPATGARVRTWTSGRGGPQATPAALASRTASRVTAYKVPGTCQPPASNINERLPNSGNGCTELKINDELPPLIARTPRGAAIDI